MSVLTCRYCRCEKRMHAEEKSPPQKKKFTKRLHVRIDQQIPRKGHTVQLAKTILRFSISVLECLRVWNCAPPHYSIFLQLDLKQKQPCRLQRSNYFSLIEQSCFQILGSQRPLAQWPKLAVVAAPSVVHKPPRKHTHIDFPSFFLKKIFFLLTFLCSHLRPGSTFRSKQGSDYVFNKWYFFFWKIMTFLFFSKTRTDFVQRPAALTRLLK